ncbi:MAG: 3'(2'),5'-bisphosphate nucleotidase CysQ [Pseudomonadota bacterium]
MSSADLLSDLSDIAKQAGVKIMEIYDSGVFETQHKDDASPVTKADKAGEAIILAGLHRIEPQTPVLAEESASEGRIPELGARFYLVDPLDGTKEFLKKSGEFTVNIALVENGAPTAGVVYAPALGALYAGAKGAGATRTDVESGAATTISVRTPDEDGLIVVASKSHRTPQTDALLETLSVKSFTAAGSSLKFCRIAEGAADFYPRLGPTMEWDTGAGHAVLEAAGGVVYAHPEGGPLRYGNKARDFLNPFFMAHGARPFDV